MKRAVALPLGVAAIGLAAGLLEVATSPARALFAYLAAFLAAITIAVGALLFGMIAQTARARWFVVLERLTGAIAATLPVFPLLFVPIALGVRTLYPWAGPPAALDPDGAAWAAHARAWLNVPFFVARAYVYLCVWSALSLLLRRSAIADDTDPREAHVRQRRFVSAAGIPVMAFTLTFASFDWVMSLSTRWSSDILGVYLFTGAFGGAIGATAFVAWRARDAGILPPEVRRDHFHALGRILLCAVILWAYIALCQFLLVWITDLERETSFYAERAVGAWSGATVALVLVHFVIPFFLLLSRPLKESPRALAFAGAWLVCAHALDVYWLVVPSLHAGSPSLLDAGFFAGIGGLVAAFGAWRFAAAAPVPLHDAGLAASLRYESP